MVAYLALFVAAGGGAYAAVKVTSSEIANRTIRGKDVKPDALKGRQIREASLSEVPSAAVATRAESADTATSAEAAVNAETATTASTATSAGDAGLLDGLDSSQFLRSEVVRAGLADVTATTRETVIAYPELGFQIETDGDSDADRGLFVHNTGTSGAVAVVRDDSTVALSIPPGLSGGFTSTNNVLSLVVGPSAEPARDVHVNCGWLPSTTVRCTGIHVVP